MDKIINRKTISIIGILLICIYYFVVINFVTTGSENWLIIFEVLTIISGIYFIFFIMVIPFSHDDKYKNYKLLAIIFVSTLMIFTTIAHTLSLNSIYNLKNGIDIPDYLYIGKPSSYITPIEYLGWGIFLGLAFLFSFFGIENEQNTRPFKITLFVCALLCFLGFFGWLIINENLWYIGSMGYGVGTIIMCIELLIYEKRK
jgi:heme A synthase